MMKLYDCSKVFQWFFVTSLMGWGMLAVIPILSNNYGILYLPLIAPLINFTSVPLMRMIGFYKYLNPYVISTVQNNKRYDLHNIFTFDYLINFKWSQRGKYAQRTLLGNYFSALLIIIERIESDQLSPEVNIVGHSYFFNDRTADRLGFKIQKASPFWIINSSLQFIEITYLYSFSQGKWAIPKFWDVKRVEITGHDLVKKKELLQSLVFKILPRVNERELSD